MRAKGILLTVVSALLFGVTPVLASQTYRLGSNALTLTFYRNLMVVPVLLVVVLLRRTRLGITPRQLLAVVLVGVLGRGATTLMLYSAYGYMGIGAATTLHFLYPVFVALLCRVFFRERLGRAKILALSGAILGILLFLEPGGGSNLPLGMTLAVGSGLTYALYMVGMDKLGLKDMDPFLLSFYMAGAVSLGMLLYNLPQGQIVFRLAPRAFFYTFVVAICTSFLAAALLQMGIRYLSATTASVFCLFEPISCSVAGAVFLGERFTLAKVLGSGVILAAAGFLACARPAAAPEEASEPEQAGVVH